MPPFADEVEGVSAQRDTEEGRTDTLPLPPSQRDRTGGRTEDEPMETSPLLGQAERREKRETRLRGRRRYASEFRFLARASLPIFATHLLEHSVVIAPVLSIGHLGTISLAAFSLGSMTAGVTGYSIMEGLVTALDTLLPPAWTSGEPSYVGLWTQRMAVVMGLALIPILGIWLNAEGLLLRLGQDAEVARLAGVYLRYAAFGLPAYSFNIISRRYFQSQGLFTVPTRIVFVAAPVSAFLNWLLVWGPPNVRLGFSGAPIATSSAFTLVSLMNIGYGVFLAPRTAWRPFSAEIVDIKGLGLALRLGVAGVGQMASEWWAWELMTLAASLLGPTALASQSVLLYTTTMTYQAPFAVSLAAATRIGNLLGETDALRAKIASRVALGSAFGLGLIPSTLLMTFRHSWGRIFNDDPEVLQLVASVLPLLALFQVFDSVNGVASGIMRAKGRQMTGALLNLSAYYILGLPIGCLLAFKMHMDLHGLWLGLTVSLVYCSLIGAWMCLKTDWVKEAKRAVARSV